MIVLPALHSQQAFPTRMLSKSQRLFLGFMVLLLVDIIWVASSEVTKFVYNNAEYQKPFFCTYIKTSMFTIYLLGLCFWPQWRAQLSKPPVYQLLDPVADEENFYTESTSSLSDSTFVPIKYPDGSERNSGTDSGTDSGNDASSRSVRFSKLAEVKQMSEEGAMEALLARLSYQATLRAGEAAKRAANRFPVRRVAKIAFIFCILWFLANYTYQVAFAYTEAGMVALLSCTSSMATLLLAAAFPSNQGDHFTLSKFVAVCVNLVGLVLVFIADHSFETSIPVGGIYALISACFYAMYLVFLRRKVDSEDKMDIPMFFGFVGLWNLLLLWPAFFLLHYSNMEKFEWPNQKQWMYLLLNGLIGTVISEALWLWGCFLTSSLIASVAMSLTVPMTMVADVVLKQVHYSVMVYLGALPVGIAFVVIILLAHWENWDPVGECLRRLCSRVFCCRVGHAHNRAIRTPESESEQQALIGINDGDHEA
ncbi:hypothetical protein ONE63_010983 [Megalurothrips usitatus]|uniref:Solute carrier family 35 member F5 n=1 Tax=Megalurothrips usitatus TaxID=439358 RepID=A0AAV7XEN4_9NEOP|nr:hypothetical protein ONE63_010983 [Megalurothrips usitatus]